MVTDHSRIMLMIDIDINVTIPSMKDFNPNEPDIMCRIKQDLEPQIRPEVPVDTGLLISTPDWGGSTPMFLFDPSAPTNGYHYAGRCWDGYSRLNHWGTGDYILTSAKDFICDKIAECFGG